MAKIRYYYDTETCNYERIRTSKIDVVINFLSFLLLVSVFAIGIIYTLSLFFDTPRLTQLKESNAEILHQYEEANRQLGTIQNHINRLSERDDRLYRVYLEREPIPPAVRKGGVGGTNRREEILESQNKHKDLMVSNFEMADQIKHEINVQEKSYDLIDKLVNEKSEMFASIPAIQPISIDDMTRLASIFGMRMHPLLNFQREHEGVDLTAPRGTPVHASGKGTVEAAFYSTTGGNLVVINHGYDFQSRYLHLSEFIVRKGQKVNRGDTLGYVGSTGLSRAPHLHYEVLKAGEPVNPVHYFNQNLTQDQYELILKLAAKQNEE